jgi:hypothetical protein
VPRSSLVSPGQRGFPTMKGRRAYRVGDVVVVNDRMQRGYRYVISAPAGAGYAPGFEPRYSPKEMLELGVFEGKYCNDCRDELPAHWFVRARIADPADPRVNCFGVKSRQPLSVWREKGWIIGPDPRGWFQWYCRYYLGRRLPEIDAIQIRRWRNFARHAAQVRKHCMPGDVFCRPRQRQALLQWAHDPFI